MNNEQMSVVLGTVAMTPKGEYSSEAYYEKLNTVLYNDSTYMAIKPSTGVLPTNTEYWQLIGGGVKKENTIIVYNTVAEMKADIKLKSGMYVKTKGYYEVNDGGASLYRINETQPTNEYYETLENSLYAVMVDQDILNPEQFGAKGDGITDDTTALTNCFNTGKIVNLTNNYLINESIDIKNNVLGNGKIIFNDDLISLNLDNLNNVSIENINVDCNSHTTHGFVLNECKNISFNNINVENIGNLTDDYENTGIFIRTSCKNIKVTNSSFKKTYGLHMASFIWVRNNTEDIISTNILIDNCHFEDSGPLEDGDAIKVLGGNYDCFLTVSNCQFINCQKRAMKFQGRECHSLNNYIYYNKKSMYPIDFQRGYGSSTNDTIFLDYDNMEEELTNSGLAYAGITITQGYVNVTGLRIKKSDIETPSTIISSGAIYFNSLPEYDDGNIKNVTIKDCDIDGFAYLLRFNEDQGITITLDNLDLENITYNSLVDTNYAFKLGEFVITNSIIKDINLKNSTRLFIGGSYVSDSYIELNLPLSRVTNQENLLLNNTIINHNNTYYSSNFRKEKGKMIVYATNNANPSDSTTTQWSNLRYAPKGTIVYCKDYVNNGDNTYTIGYISTTAGTNTAAGTFIPIKINV